MTWRIGSGCLEQLRRNRRTSLIEVTLRAASARGDLLGASLSRAIAGVVDGGKTGASSAVVVNLPGRPHAARENLTAMLPARRGCLASRLFSSHVEMLGSSRTCSPLSSLPSLPSSPPATDTDTDADTDNDTDTGTDADTDTDTDTRRPTSLGRSFPMRSRKP